MRKKILLGATILGVLVGCSSLSTEKKSFKSDTSEKPKQVAFLPANRGTSNDVKSVNLIAPFVAKNSNIAGAKKQNFKETEQILNKKLGITVAGQLAGEDKIELEKALGVDGVVFLNVNSIGTSLKADLLEASLTKQVNFDVLVYNDGKLFKGENIIEESKITITLQQFKNITELVNDFIVFSKNVKGKNLIEILKMSEFQTIVNKLMVYSIAERSAIVGNLIGTLPTQELISLFGDLFKKAGVINKSVYEEVIIEASKKVQIK